MERPTVERCPIVSIIPLPAKTFLPRWSLSTVVRSALPGAANYDQFLRIGHSLFALLAGLVGGTVAVWFWGRRESGVAGPVD